MWEKTSRKLLICICLIGGILSCSKPLDDKISGDAPMRFRFEILQTKADEDAWVKGDKVHVFFNDIGEKYVTMEYDGKDWTSTPSAEFVKKDFKSPDQAALTAVYFPVPVDITYGDRKFSFTSGGEKVYSYYLMATGTAYSVDSTQVKATVEMGKTADFVGFYIPDLKSSDNDYTFGCSLIKPVACASVGLDGTITEDSRQAGMRINGIPYGDGTLFAGALIKPGVSADYSFTFANDYSIYSFTRHATSLQPGKIYTYQDLPQTDKDTQTLTNTFDLYTDLGLSVLWAKCNVGANVETETGDYFSWGELNGYNSGKTDFSMGKYLLRSKYNDGKYSTLELIDDVAYAVLGGQSRIPTNAEWLELIQNCNWEWKGNGYLVTSKLPGYTDRSIYFPVTSFWYNTGKINELGNIGFYWTSSSLSSMTGYARYAHLASDERSVMPLQMNFGCVVRPVYRFNRAVPHFEDPFPGDEHVW